MNELTCRTVRRWLQEPGLLHPIDARHLDRHLAGCPGCASYRHEQVRMDTLLVSGLDAAVGATVRPQVRSRLLAQAARPPRQWIWPSWAPRLRVAALLVPIAVAAVFVALFLPPALHPKGTVTPAGAAWHLQRPNIGFPLTVDVTHPRHLLVGAWGQVYQSSNGGDSWTQVGTLPGGLIIRDVAVDATDPAHYLVAAKHSVYQTRDGGRHWKLAVSGLQGAMNMFLLQSPHEPATYFLGPGVIWSSTDHGRTWHQDGRGRIFAPDGVQSLAIARNGTLFAGIWAGGVAVSTNGGHTWRRQSTGLRKKVLDVVIGQKGRMWAATDRGTYVSTNGGRTWSRRSPHHVFSTAVLDAGSFVLAGTNNGLYRSTDGGHHWIFSERGLPLDPYIYSLTSVPGKPELIYASLNGDGLFRSRDGGVHWQSVVSGLPVNLQDGRPPSVLFIRDGALWLTDGNGTDPSPITVDRDVQSAAVSPDGVSAAYVAVRGDTWSVRTVCSGCLAHTVLSGHGAIPGTPMWSPAATRIATVRDRTVYVTGTTGGWNAHWSLPNRATLLGWDRGGQALLVWNATTHRVEVRGLSGRRTTVWPGAYMHAPSLSPDGRSIARTHGRRLWIHSGGRHWKMIPGTRDCSPGAWSSSGTSLLIACPGGTEMRTATGRLIARASVPASAAWAPDSRNTLLYFAHGGLWRWSVGADAMKIVGGARSPQ